MNEVFIIERSMDWLFWWFVKFNLFFLCKFYSSLLFQHASLWSNLLFVSKFLWKFYLLFLKFKIIHQNLIAIWLRRICPSLIKFRLINFILKFNKKLRICLIMMQTSPVFMTLNIWCFNGSFLSFIEKIFFVKLNVFMSVILPFILLHKCFNFCLKFI